MARLRSMVLLVANLQACGLRPAEERAKRDLEVGQARVAGVGFRVEGGLAQVRRAAPGEIELWAGAPSFRLTARADADATTVWRLRVQNVFAGAELLGAEGSLSGQPCQAGPTTCLEWPLTVTPGGVGTYALLPPDRNETTPWRFAVLSDVQGAVDRIRDIWLRINQEPEVRFVVSAGDLTAHGGEAEHARFQAELSALDRPFYTTLGNHELGSDNDHPAYHGWFGRGSHHFVHRSTAFSFLDSASATLDPTVEAWLGEWLELERDRIHVVVTHFPLVDPVGARNGSFADRNEAYALLAALSRGRVDLMLHGHVHSYYAYENAGIPVRISGGGGALPERLDGIGRHYLVVDVDPTESRMTGTRVVEVP